MRHPRKGGGGECVQGGDGDTDLQKEHGVLEGNNKMQLIYI